MISKWLGRIRSVPDGRNGSPVTEGWTCDAGGVHSDFHRRHRRLCRNRS